MMPPHPRQTAPLVPCAATHEQAAGVPGHSSSQAGPQEGGRAGSPPPAWTRASPRWAPWDGQGQKASCRQSKGEAKARSPPPLAVPLCPSTAPAPPTPIRYLVPSLPPLTPSPQPCRPQPLTTPGFLLSIPDPPHSIPWSLHTHIPSPAPAMIPLHRPHS